MRPHPVHLQFAAAALAAAVLLPAPAGAFGAPVYVSTFGCNCAGNFSTMRGVAAGSDGNVYQVDGLKLHKFDSNGVRLNTYTLPMTLRDIAPGPGFLVACELNKVWKITLPGLVYTSWGTAGSGAGQFQQANGVACDAAGNIYVVDGVNNRMTKYNSSGTLLSSFTNYSGGSLTAPRAIAIAPNGDIWISQTTGPDMLRFGAAYNYLQTINRVTSDRVMGLVVDTDHNVIAAVGSTTHVSNEGLLKYFVDYPGYWDLLEPSKHGADVTMAPDGKIFVEDQAGLQIHKFRPCAAPAMTQPISSPINVILGSGAPVVAHFTGDPPLVYQWEKGYTPLDDGPEYSGQGDSVLTVTATSTAVEGTYHCMVRNLCDAVYANEFYVRVCTPVSLTQEPQSTTASPGSLVVFQCTAIGDNNGPYPITISYEWRRNGVALADSGRYSGTHTPMLSIQNASAGDNGEYSVFVSNLCSVVISPGAALMVGECFNLAEVQAISLDSLGAGFFEDEPVAMVAADMDADGWTDLLVSGQQTKRVYQIRNQGGGLMAQADARRALTPHQACLATPDLNEDGRPDIVQYGESGPTGYVSVTLSPTYQATAYYASPGPASGIVAYDYDLDGHQDLVLLTRTVAHFTAATAPETTGVLWWRRGTGTGALAASTWATTFHYGYDNEAVDSFFGLVRQRSGDPNRGVSFGSNSSIETWTLSNRQLPASPSWGVMPLHMPPLPGTRMVAADLIHHIYDMLVVVGGGHAWVTRNDETAVAATRDLGPVGSGGEVSLAAGDFNGDHHVDIATVEQGSNLIRVFWGTGQYSFVYPHTDYLVNLFNGPINATYPVWQALCAADLNRDGRDDLIVTGQDPSNYTATHQVRIFRIPCGVASVESPVAAEPPKRMGAAPAVFQRRTALTFALAVAGRAELAVFDASGRRVSQLCNGPLLAGEHRMEWDGKTRSGEDAPSGVYFVRLRTGGHDAVARLVKVR